MNSAVPGFTGTGSGIGEGTIGCIAGTVTVNNAWNGLPFIRIGFLLFIVCTVMFVGINMTITVPTPGVTKGGAVYGIGLFNAGGNSSPIKQAGILFTIRLVLVPIRGMGDMRSGTTAGGKIFILIISPVLITKSATMLMGFLSTDLHKSYTHHYIKQFMSRLRNSWQLTSLDPVAFLKGMSRITKRWLHNSIV